MINLSKLYPVAVVAGLAGGLGGCVTIGTPGSKGAPALGATSDTTENCITTNAVNAFFVGAQRQQHIQQCSDAMGAIALINNPKSGQIDIATGARILANLSPEFRGAIKGATEAFEKAKETLGDGVFLPVKRNKDGSVELVAVRPIVTVPERKFAY